MSGDDHRNILQKIFGLGKTGELTPARGLRRDAPRPLLC